jgi:drug/metabolite transporter (DMT)-like permease
MSVIMDILIGVVFASLGQLFFKVRTNNTGELSLSNIWQFMNIFIIVGLVFYALGSLFWIIALSKADLSFVYPFTAVTFIIVYILSFFLLKEPFHLNRLVGTGIIIIGICILFFFEK